jgi:hypothetical protein
MSTERPRQLTYMERAARFTLDFTVAVVDGKPTVKVPQTWEGLNLTRLGPYVLQSGRKISPRVNLSAAPVLSAFLHAVFVTHGIGVDVLSYDGGYYPRLKRGVATPLPGATKEAWGKLLSNHSRGTAIDLNAKWNPMGKAGAAAGAEGSLHRIIEIARAIRVELETPAGTIWPAGIVCGADWRDKSRDDMHFEVGTFEPA